MYGHIYCHVKYTFINGISTNQPPTELTKTFSMDELATGLSLLKPWKAAGLDDLLTEMLQHLGNKAKSWLLDMLLMYTYKAYPNYLEDSNGICCVIVHSNS